MFGRDRQALRLIIFDKLFEKVLKRISMIQYKLYYDEVWLNRIFIAVPVLSAWNLPGFEAHDSVL